MTRSAPSSARTATSFATGSTCKHIFNICIRISYLIQGDHLPCLQQQDQRGQLAQPALARRTGAGAQGQVQGHHGRHAHSDCGVYVYVCTFNISASAIAYENATLHVKTNDQRGQLAQDPLSPDARGQGHKAGSTRTSRPTRSSRLLCERIYAHSTVRISYRVQEGHPPCLHHQDQRGQLAQPARSTRRRYTSRRSN